MLKLLSALLLSGLIASAAQRTIIFYGDSLTAGYGLEDASTQAFPALIQAQIDAHGLDWKVVNAGLSGDTTSGGLRRLDWVLRQPVDIFVLELGGNDGLRGLPVDLIEKNLNTLIDRVLTKNPATKVMLTGMHMPTSMGHYATVFGAIFPRIAAQRDLVLVPHLLEGVGGVPALNLPDGIHPTAAGHRKVADTVWAVLAPLLQSSPATPLN